MVCMESSRFPSLPSPDDGLVSSSVGSSVGKAPPYWNRQNRTVSNISYTSVHNQRLPIPITLEDHEDVQTESSKGLWAKSVYVNDYVVVSGRYVGAGSYVVWNCTVETLDVILLHDHEKVSMLT